MSDDVALRSKVTDFVVDGRVCVSVTEADCVTVREADGCSPVTDAVSERTAETDSEAETLRVSEAPS